MKYFVGFIAVLLFVLPQTVYAEGVSIAVVDTQLLLSQSEAAKSIQEQVATYHDETVKDLLGKEKDLRDREKALLEKKEELSEDELLAKRKEFEKDFIAAQKLSQEKKATLDEAYTKAMTELMNHVYEVVQAISDEKSYDLVISKKNVVIGAKSLDVSEEAMKRLNEKVEKISLNL